MAKLSEIELREFIRELKDNGIIGNSNTNNSRNTNNGGNNSNTNNSSKNSSTNNDNNIFKDTYEGLEDLRSAVKNVKQSLEKEAKEIDKANADYAKAMKKLDAAESTKNRNRLTSEQQKAYQEEIDIRKRNLNAEKELFDAEQSLERTKHKNESKSIENNAIRTRIRDKNYEHELELENKRLKFKEETLEKDQAIEKVRQEAHQKQEKWEKRGYNKSGKKNSGAELFSAIGTFAKKLKENSIGRNIGEGLSKIANGAAGGLKTINSGKIDVGGMADKASNALSKMGPYGAAAGGVIQILKTLFEMYSKVDKAASDYTRTVGGGRAAMEKMKLASSSMAANMGKLKGLSYDAAELMKSMAEYSTTLGRNLEYMSSMDITAIEDLKKFGVDGNVLSQFDTFGMSVQTVSEKLKNLYSDSSRKGLNAKAVQDMMTKNLKMAQNYTFAGGVKALERMAERAVALKFNMEQATRFADKVATLEGAMQAGAQLSVLGGGFAQQGNPLTMLYGGLNDPEQLMEQMLKITSSMAKWDNQKGQFDISAFNRQRLKASSESMGVDYSEMTTMAMNQARENRVASQLGSGLDKDTETYIKNIATIDEKGNAKVTFNQGMDDEYTKNVSELTMEDKARLKKESERKGEIEGADMGSILNSTMSIQDKLDQIINEIRNHIVKFLMKIAGVDENELNMSDKQIAEYRSKKGGKSFGEFASDYGEYLAGLIGMGKDENNEWEWNLLKHNIFTEGVNMIDSSIGLIGNTFGYYDDKNKKIANEIINSDVQNKSNGGFVSGPGTSKSDSIPARLSNGEFVVNANATEKNRGTLEAINAIGYANGGIVKPISNQLNSVSVTSNNGLYSQSNSGKMSFEPLKIDLGGKLELSANGGTKEIDAKEILTPKIIDDIIKQIQTRMDYGLNRDNTHIKFG